MHDSVPSKNVFENALTLTSYIWGILFYQAFQAVFLPGLVDTTILGRRMVGHLQMAGPYRLDESATLKGVSRGDFSWVSWTQPSLDDVCSVIFKWPEFIASVN